MCSVGKIYAKLSNTSNDDVSLGYTPYTLFENCRNSLLLFLQHAENASSLQIQIRIFKYFRINLAPTYLLTPIREDSKDFNLMRKTSHETRD